CKTKTQIRGYQWLHVAALGHSAGLSPVVVATAMEVQEPCQYPVMLVVLVPVQALVVVEVAQTAHPPFPHQHHSRSWEHLMHSGQLHWVPKQTQRQLPSPQAL